MNKNKLLLYLLVLSTFVLIMQSSFAKDFKFQVPFSRDCRLYEELYEGVSCRNASFDDIPICEDSEEIVSSPRKGKLCCCNRLNEGEITNGGNEEENITSINDCMDIGCQVVPDAFQSSSDCPAELQHSTINFSRPLSKDGSVSKVVNCCCANESISFDNLQCKNFDCKIASLEGCPSGLTVRPVTLDIGADGTTDATKPCCCK